VIKARGLARQFKVRGHTIDAVQGVDIDVESGELVAFLGPNGAGKTTTVEILEGYRRRDAGDVEVLGEDPDGAGLGLRRRIGIVLQTSAETPELTVDEMVRHFARYYPSPRDPDEVVAAVGLAGKRGERVRSLSGGQRRRLDVALGIVGRPELLFLDEPTTGFDPQARRAFWDLVAGLKDGGTTILLTTHYLDEAQRLADRVGVIAAGRLLALDTPQRLGGREAHRARVRWVDDAGAHEEATQTPTRLVADLARRYDGEVPGLEVVRPSLEDVYLGLIDGVEGPALEGAPA